jgi:hypothetical protein
MQLEIRGQKGDRGKAFTRRKNSGKMNLPVVLVICLKITLKNPVSS